MNVADKMNNVLNSVLQSNGYKVVIINENRWDVCFDNMPVLQSRSTRDIYSHWREIVKEEINIIINERIKSALNEV